MHRGKLLAVALVAAIAAVPGAQAHNGTGKDWTIVAKGLDNPRGIDIAKNGDLWIAEAGRGGTGPCFKGEDGSEVCFGPTGAFTLVRDGVQKRVVTGLPSVAAKDTGADAEGPHDVVANGKRITGLIGGGHDVATRPTTGAAALFGWLVKINPWKGTVWPFADIAQYEADANPDGGAIDSNAYGLALRHGGYAVADAGANDVLGVRHKKHISTLAVFPNREGVPGPAPGSLVSMEAVPTSVAVRPWDKNIYVGQLTGFPFPEGGANVYRIEPDGSVETYATGFTNIVDIAWGPKGSLYVLEISAKGILSRDPAGALIRVWPNGKQTTVASTGLVSPTSVAVARDGTVYVANNGTTAGAGTVVNLGKV